MSGKVWAQEECQKSPSSDKCKIEKLEKALVLLHEKFDKLTSLVESNINSDHLKVKGHVEVQASGTNPKTNGFYAYNTGDDDAILSARVRDLDAGDPYIFLDIANETGWSIGIDNDDSNKLKFSNSWNGLNSSTKMSLTTDGKLGVGTTTPTENLHVIGSIKSSSTAIVGGYLNVEGADITLGRNSGRKKGSKTKQRALVHYEDDTLHVNFNGDFEGGTVVDSKLTVKGTLKASKFEGISLNWGTIYTTGWLNNWDGVVNHTLPTGYVMVGLYSEHQNSSEDRRWKIKYRKLSLSGVE